MTRPPVTPLVQEDGLPGPAGLLLGPGQQGAGEGGQVPANPQQAMHHADRAGVSSWSRACPWTGESLAVNLRSLCVQTGRGRGGLQGWEPPPGQLPHPPRQHGLGGDASAICLDGIR